MNIAEFDPLHDDESCNESDLEIDDTEEEKPLKKYIFKVYAHTGERSSDGSGEFTSRVYSSFNGVYRALNRSIDQYNGWSDLQRVTGTSIRIEGHEEVHLVAHTKIYIDDLPKLDVTEAEFDKIIETINREIATRGW